MRERRQSGGSPKLWNYYRFQSKPYKSTDKYNIGMLNDLVYLHKIIENDFDRWVYIYIHICIYLWRRVSQDEHETKYNAGCKVV